MTGSIRTIRPTESLDAVWEEAVYTEARLLGDPLAANLAPPFAELITRIERARSGQYAAWRREIVAQAGVDAVNVALDETTVSFGQRLFVAVAGDRKAPRWRHYFKSTVSRLVRLGLASQLERVRPWPASLRGEPEAELTPFAARFAQHLTDGDAAVAARALAAGERASQRLREIVAVVDELNGLRVSTLGRLLQRASKNKRPSDWAEGFFRVGQRQVEADPDDDEPVDDTPQA